MPPTNPRWWTAAILKNRKILISLQPIDRFWRRLACWCVSTISARIANKISLFQKSKMAAAILKIRKIAISPQQDDRFWRHLAWWWVSAFQPLSANEISQIWKSKMAAPTTLINWKILISSQPVDQFCQNLTCSWVLFLWTPLVKQFGDSKNKKKMENIKKPDISKIICTYFCRILVWWCSISAKMCCNW